MIGKVKDIESLALESAWANNPHGAGIAWVDRGKVETIKGLMDLPDLERALSSIGSRARIALHLRYATHGGICADNTHPFRMGKSRTYLMHNGVLSAFGRSGDSGISDSKDLADTLGRLQLSSDRKKLLASISGMFALVHDQGIELFGSKSWDRVGRVQCSNTYWLPIARRDLWFDGCNM